MREDGSSVYHRRNGEMTRTFIFTLQPRHEYLAHEGLLDDLRYAIEDKIRESNFDPDEDIRVNLPQGTFKFPIHNGKVYSPDRMN